MTQWKLALRVGRATASVGSWRASLGPTNCGPTPVAEMIAQA
jgi:hypothetical protein